MSWEWGLPHCLIHRRHLSSCVLGFGNALLRPQSLSEPLLLVAVAKVGLDEGRSREEFRELEKLEELQITSNVFL